MKKWYDYYLIEHRPRHEGKGVEFRSQIIDLDQKPELWEQECPYGIGDGRIVKEDEADDWK